jgi:hypothetical protein
MGLVGVHSDLPNLANSWLIKQRQKKRQQNCECERAGSLFLIHLGRVDTLIVSNVPFHIKKKR